MGHEVMKKKKKTRKKKKKVGESGSVGHEVKNKNKKKRGKKVWEMKCWQWKSQNTEGNLECFNGEHSLIPTATFYKTSL